ncbi:kinase/pyrophosphorylase [Ectothiorhodospiraceae bacterium 2226]|nr:kinase/pyrophosphorylase [Ectothiorhodospiraceae bacterium 2226]
MRTVFFVSDRTGITVEAMGRSVLSQFEGEDFRRVRLPFIDTLDKARAAAAEVRAAGAADGARPLVFSTLLDPALRAALAESGCALFDFFEAFIGPVENELQRAPTHAPGRTHGLADPAAYARRMEALRYALRTDDGVATDDYRDAELILVGVSRSGKTPTCLYLALQYGLFAANYPLTDEDLEAGELPAALVPVRERVRGLVVTAERLHRLRQERRPNSPYAELAQCQREVRLLQRLYRAERIPALDVSAMSVEEIAATLAASLARPLR